MSFLKNPWVKRGIALFSLLYVGFLAWLTYMSAFYHVSYANAGIFVVCYIGITLVFFAAMFFARKQLIISIAVMVMMLIMLPFVIFNLGNWMLIIPPAIMVLVIFFSCGASEGVKTVMGTIFLLLYILSILAYFVVTNLLLTKVDSTVIDQGESPSGTYRYYILDVNDNSGGRTEVYVEPNDRDISLGFVDFKAKGYEQRKYNVRNHELPTVEWRDGDKLYINNERYEFKEWKRKFVFD